MMSLTSSTSSMTIAPLIRQQLPKKIVQNTFLLTLNQEPYVQNMSGRECSPLEDCCIERSITMDVHHVSIVNCAFQEENL